MPWQEESTMQLRRQFVQDVQSGATPITELCTAYGISRKTGYKWLARFDADGAAAPRRAGPKAKCRSVAVPWSTMATLSAVASGGSTKTTTYQRTGIRQAPRDTRSRRMPGRPSVREAMTNPAMEGPHPPRKASGAKSHSHPGGCPEYTTAARGPAHQPRDDLPAHLGRSAPREHAVPAAARRPEAATETLWALR